MGDNFSVDVVRAGIIVAADWAGDYTADAACKLVVLEHRAPPSIWAARHSANSALTCMAHWIARVDSARQRLDIHAFRIPGRGRVHARRHERARPWLLPVPVLPATQVSEGFCGFVHAVSAPGAHDPWWVSVCLGRQSARHSDSVPA